MHCVISKIESDHDDISRLSRETLEILVVTDSITSPIRYRAVLKRALRIRIIWESHVRIWSEISAFLSGKEPRLVSCLHDLEIEQRNLARELKLLTPHRWPRSTHLGLNSLRIQAFQTLPRLLRALQQEELYILPALHESVSPRVAVHAPAVAEENQVVIHRSVPA